uniref:thioredoxin domain-containing protein 8-like n=1 Tax=Arvicanthis niloticus TaxID=61156 RepID=UPI00148604EE|nr:thioredoxin domain-containing protein 8-like [Arvicanthis niloticus]
MLIMVQRINTKKELKELFSAAGNRLVVVEFSAEWCDPCKIVAPVFQAMSLEYQNVMFAQVDVDSSKELTEHYHIKVVPTFQMFKHTQKVTPFSRLKRQLCCFRRGPKSKKIFEFQGTDVETLEEKIQELM